MATENWSAAELANRPSLEDFLAAYDVVFVDSTGYVNLCADVSAAQYRLVFHTCREPSGSVLLFLQPDSFWSHV